MAFIAAHLNAELESFWWWQCSDRYNNLPLPPPPYHLPPLLPFCGGAYVILRLKYLNFKYLGTLIDNKLSFSDNLDLIYKKSQQRLYLLRKLRSFDVSRELLQIVYKSLVESVLTFNIVVWYGNLGVKGKAKLARIVGMAGKIVGDKTRLPKRSLPYSSWTENCTDLRRRKAPPIFSVSETPVGPTIQSVDFQEECVKKIFYPKYYFCFKFSGYLICSPCGFQGSALLTLW